MFCPGCGNQLETDAKFCDSCGAKVRSNSWPLIAVIGFVVVAFGVVVVLMLNRNSGEERNVQVAQAPAPPPSVPEPEVAPQPASTPSIEANFGLQSRESLAEIDIAKGASGQPVTPTERVYVPDDVESRQWSAMLPVMSTIRRIEERGGQIRVLFEEVGTPLAQKRWVDASSLNAGEVAEIKLMLDRVEPRNAGNGQPGTGYDYRQDVPEWLRPKPGDMVGDYSKKPLFGVPSPSEARPTGPRVREYRPTLVTYRKWRDADGDPLPAYLSVIQDRDGQVRVQLEYIDGEKRWFPFDGFSQEDRTLLKQLLDEEGKDIN